MLTLICGLFIDLVIQCLLTAGRGTVFRLVPSLPTPISGFVSSATEATPTRVSMRGGLEPTKDTGLMLLAKMRNMEMMENNLILIIYMFD